MGEDPSLALRVRETRPIHDVSETMKPTEPDLSNGDPPRLDYNRR